MPQDFQGLRFYELSPSGDYALLGGDKGVILAPRGSDWSAELSDRKNYVSTTHTELAGWSPDGRRAAVGTSGGRFFVFEVANPAAKTEFAGHARWLNGIGFDGDGRRLYTSSSDGTIRKWDLERKSTEWSAVSLSDDQFAVFGAGGRPLFATETADEHLTYLVERPDESWDAITPEEFRRRIEPTTTAAGR